MGAFAARLGSFLINGASSSASGIFDPPAREVSYAANAVLPNRLPSPEALINATNRGWLASDSKAMGMLWQGAYPSNISFTPAGFAASDPSDKSRRVYSECWQAVELMAQTNLTDEDLLDLVFRQVISQEQWRGRMTRNGWIDEQAIAWQWQNRHPLPPPDLAIRAETLRLNDNAWAERLGLDTGMTDSVTNWLLAQGLGGPTFFSDVPVTPNRTNTWADVVYRGHWRTLDLATATDAFYKLRPERLAKWQQVVPDVKAFTAADLDMAYQFGNIPPGLRSYYKVANYKVLSTRQLQQAYNLGSIDAAEALQQLLDQGWHPSDAAIRVNMIVAQGQRAHIDRLNINPRPVILEAYAQRILSRNDAAVKLWQWMLFDTKGAAAFNALPLQQKMAVANAQPEVNAVLDQNDLQWHLSYTKRAVLRWRKRYQRGMRDKEGTKEGLQALGIAPDRVATLIDEWTDELAAGKLMLSTSHIRALVLKQLLPIATARTWLTNLGWRSPEIEAIMSEMLHDFLLEQARAAEKIAKTQAEMQAALARQINAANKAANQARQKLLATMSPGKAHRYFVRGIIRLQDFAQVLRAFDYEGVAYDAAIKDAELDRAEWLAKANKPKPLPKPPKPKPAPAPPKPKPKETAPPVDAGTASDNAGQPAGAQG